MALEDLTGTKYISDLNSSNPTATDGVSEGDDHIRGVKNVLKTTFPSVSGAVTATHTELNLLDGVTATTAELNELDASAAAITGFVSGVRMYIETRSGASTGGNFEILNALAASGGAFESFGPTNSNAINIWTAMDDLPSDATAVLIGFALDADVSSATARILMTVYTRQTGSSSVTGDYTKSVEFEHYADTAASFEDYREAWIPLDSSRRFDLTWVGTNIDAGGSSLDMYVRGFMA